MNKSTPTCRVHLLVAGLLIMAAATGVSGQCEVQRIVPEGMTDGAMFGTAVCRWDQWLAVGAPLDTGNEWASGIVRVYQRKGTSWILHSVLSASDGVLADMLGFSLDGEGDRLVAGAWWDHHAGFMSGSAYVYEYDDVNDAWHEAAKLTAADAGPDQTFGRTVSLAGDEIVIGAPLDDQLGVNAGAAYVFRYMAPSGQWFQQQKLLAVNGTSGDRCGLGLAMNGNYIMVGAPWSAGESGQVYAYQRDGDAWIASQVLDPGIDAPAQFGFSLAIDDQRLAVGAWKEEEEGIETGAVHTFLHEASGWMHSDRLIPPLLEPDARFGIDVALQYPYLLVGSEGGNGIEPGSGLALLLQSAGELWVPIYTCTGSGTHDGARFGWQVVLHGNEALVSAPSENSTSLEGGAVYIFSGVQEPDDCGGGACPADIDGSGNVDFQDLLGILSAWGCADCIEDIDDSGLVDFGDVIQVLSSWGPC